MAAPVDLQRVQIVVVDRRPGGAQRRRGEDDTERQDRDQSPRRDPPVELYLLDQISYPQRIEPRSYFSPPTP
jgi:hypothetical protein